jgi:hypothetical protein
MVGGRPGHQQEATLPLQHEGCPDRVALAVHTVQCGPEQLERSGIVASQVGCLSSSLEQGDLVDWSQFRRPRRARP